MVMLRVVGDFSAVTAVVLSLLRKVLSLMVSYVLFPKAFALGHGLGLLLVFGAGTLHSFRKQVFATLQHLRRELDDPLRKAERGKASEMKARAGSVEEAGLAEEDTIRHGYGR